MMGMFNVWVIILYVLLVNDNKAIKSIHRSDNSKNNLTAAMPISWVVSEVESFTESNYQS